MIEVAQGDCVRQWNYSRSLLRWQFHVRMDFLKVSCKVKMCVFYYGLKLIKKLISFINKDYKTMTKLKPRGMLHQMILFIGERGFITHLQAVMENIKY